MRTRSNPIHVIPPLYFPLGVEVLGSWLRLRHRPESEGVSGSLNTEMVLPSPGWRAGWIRIWTCCILPTASCVALPMFLYFCQKVGRRSRPKAEPKSPHSWVQDLSIGMARFLANLYLPCGQERVSSLHIKASVKFLA